MPRAVAWEHYFSELRSAPVLNAAYVSPVRLGFEDDPICRFVRPPIFFAVRHRGISRLAVFQKIFVELFCGESESEPRELGDKNIQLFKKAVQAAAAKVCRFAEGAVELGKRIFFGIERRKVDSQHPVPYVFAELRARRFFRSFKLLGEPQKALLWAFYKVTAQKFALVNKLYRVAGGA